MINNKEELYEALARLNDTTSELRKFRERIERQQYGSVYTESPDMGGTERWVILIMSHLLKIKYSDKYLLYEEDKKHWIDEIDNFRRKITEFTKWNTKKRKTSVINEMMKSYDMNYSKSIDEYRKAIKTNSHLKENEKYIPKKCVWTLNELVENDIEELLEMLPDPEGE